MKVPMSLINLIPMPQYQFGGFMINAVLPSLILSSKAGLSSGKTYVLE